MADQSDNKIVVGMDGFADRLNRLEAFAQGDVLKRAARDAAQVIADQAAANAPGRSGKLAAAIRVRAGKSGRGLFSWVAGASDRWFQGKTFYGAFQEFGWKTGARKFSVERLTGRLTRRKRQDARANRLKGPDASNVLAPKGSRFREIQERIFRVEATLEARKAAPVRKQVAGKHFVQRAFETKGQAALDAFAASVKAGIEKEVGGQ